MSRRTLAHYAMAPIYSLTSPSLLPHFSLDPGAAALPWRHALPTQMAGMRASTEEILGVTRNRTSVICRGRAPSDSEAEPTAICAHSHSSSRLIRCACRAAISRLTLAALVSQAAGRLVRIDSCTSNGRVLSSNSRPSSRYWYARPRTSTACHSCSPIGGRPQMMTSCRSAVSQRPIPVRMAQ